MEWINNGSKFAYIAFSTQFHSHQWHKDVDVTCSWYVHQCNHSISNLLLKFKFIFPVDKSRTIVIGLDIARYVKEILLKSATLIILSLILLLRFVKNWEKQNDKYVNILCLIWKLISWKTRIWHLFLIESSWQNRLYFLSHQWCQNRSPLVCG